MAKRAASHCHAAMPNKAINAERIAASLIEWHLAGGAYLIVEADEAWQHAQKHGIKIPIKQ